MTVKEIDKILNDYHALCDKCLKFIPNKTAVITDIEFIDNKLQVSYQYEESWGWGDTPEAMVELKYKDLKD